MSAPEEGPVTAQYVHEVVAKELAAARIGERVNLSHKDIERIADAFTGRLESFKDEVALESAAHALEALRRQLHNEGLTDLFRTMRDPGEEVPGPSQRHVNEAAVKSRDPSAFRPMTAPAPPRPERLTDGILDSLEIMHHRIQVIAHAVRDTGERVLGPADIQDLPSSDGMDRPENVQLATEQRLEFMREELTILEQLTERLRRI